MLAPTALNQSIKHVKVISNNTKSLVITQKHKFQFQYCSLDWLAKTKLNRANPQSTCQPAPPPVLVCLTDMSTLFLPWSFSNNSVGTPSSLLVFGFLEFSSLSLLVRSPAFSTGTRLLASLLPSAANPNQSQHIKTVCVVISQWTYHSHSATTYFWSHCFNWHNRYPETPG
jgi:hypothetical protein